MTGIATASPTSLRKNDADWTWNRIALVRYRASGNDLHLSIPRLAVGLSEEKPGASFDFKWADNIQRPSDIMDSYVSGDVAPEGRFMFHYIAD